MKNNQLVSLIKALNKAELDEVQFELKHHPRHANKRSHDLLVALRHSREDEAALDKHRIFALAYPNKPFKAGYLRKQASLLYQHLKQWLALQQLKDDETTIGLAVMQRMETMGLYDLARKTLAQQQREHQKSEPHDASYYYDAFQLAQRADLGFGRTQTRKKDEALQTTADHLDAFYLGQKLKLCCEMLNRSKILGITYQMPLLAPLLNHLKTNEQLAQLPLIQLYHQVLLTLQEEDEPSHFSTLVELLTKYLKQLSRAEAAELYRYAQNYCIRRINQGQRDYLPQLLALYQEQLAEGINLVDGVLAANDYKNIATLGLQLQQYDWVKTFLDEYQEYLAPEQRDNVYNYNLTTYYYATKAYELATELLGRVRFSDIYYEVNARIILLKIYYAQGNYFSFYYQLDAFKLKLKRQREFPANYRQSITQFLTHYRALAQLREHWSYWPKAKKQKKLDQLRQRLADPKPIFDRKWLSDEITKLPAS